ncbi:hypothetical protein LCGC14_1464090 [marine sediment metagenome]|uniref:Uncharacterized protein n=1 Tax=marine sediment metagenome TaxID=412755 RepID=A0A0F9MG29_9ZZZZ
MKINKEEAKLLVEWADLVEGEYGSFDYSENIELLEKLRKYAN